MIDLRRRSVPAPGAAQEERHGGAQPAVLPQLLPLRVYEAVDAPDRQPLPLLQCAVASMRIKGPRA
ncbi:MAG: hypothetical protein ACR2MN_09845 [Acidimicrobiales bacterium]